MSKYLVYQIHCEKCKKPIFRKNPKSQPSAEAYQNLNVLSADSRLKPLSGDVYQCLDVKCNHLNTVTYKDVKALLKETEDGKKSNPRISFVEVDITGKVIEKAVKNENA